MAKHQHPHLHVTRFRCKLRHCGWSGFHVHWRHRRWRSPMEQMTATELVSFNEDCVAMNEANRIPGRGGW